MGFTIASKTFPIKTNAIPVIAIIIPGGIIHHHNSLAAAPNVFASCRICPHVGNDGSPNPKKLNPASVVIVVGTLIAILDVILSITESTLLPNSAPKISL